MSVWVKICGNTTLADCELAVRAGADAVGFVFAPSPRRVTVDRVARIAPGLPPELERIGVFVDAPVGEIAEAVARCGLSGVQLHSHWDPGLAGELRRRFGPGLTITGVVHYGPDAAGDVARMAPDPNLDILIVDAGTASAAGGTGVRYDWQEAARTLFRRPAARLAAAGGLGPDTVAEAIRILDPWGVDVSSGVESRPGRKDPAKVRSFVANARQAAAVRA